MMFNKKLNIRTESMADLGLEPAEQALIKSVYYAEAHMTVEPGNPYKVLSPNQFWREEVRSLKDDWAKEKAQMQAEIAVLKLQADEADKWRKSAEEYDANCDRLRRKFFNEQANHQRTKDELSTWKDKYNKRDWEAVELNIGLAKAAREIRDLKQQVKELQEIIARLEDDFE